MVPLGDVTQVVGGGTPRRDNPAFYGGSIPWVTPKDMKSRIVRSAEVCITEEALRNSPAKLIPPDAVLVVVRSGVLKHTLPVALTTVPVAINQDMKALLCADGVHPAYLARLLSARSPEILSWVKGTTAHNFSIDLLKRLPVPLPPLGEQRRIADLLDRADALRAQRRAGLTKRTMLAQAIFADMFGSPAEILSRWPVEPLESLVAEFRYGTSLKSGPHGYPTLRIPNVIGGTLNLDDLKLVPVSHADYQRLRLLEGDLLFVRTNGNPDFVGRSAVFDPALVADTGFRSTDFVFASYLIRARLNPRGVAPVFVREFMLSQIGRRQLRAASKTTAGQFNLNTQGLRGVKIPVPPEAHQRLFAQRIRESEDLRVPMLASQRKLDDLFASLLQRAFRGEL
jgi:type I restriction enzyme S subunit